ncbi:uncharacterized protein LOC143866509 [Tasmannia lanceolata]|uniref:uncharacterized protein LOC143863379 n=1 Tax=Tasmannia lanceolata TaxID=3420 RepID=UPI004063C4C5
MPHVDLETLMCGGDRKIVCETLIDGDPVPENSEIPVKGPDLPADSFRLKKEDELDWVDQNAFYERKQSTKGNSNSNSNFHLNPNSASSVSASQRFYSNLKTKSSIIGLPKVQDSGKLCRDLRPSYRPASIRFFPKRDVEAADTETEPGSPKVSCIGRVRPKEKKRFRQRKDRIKKRERSVPGKPGFWASFGAVFRIGCRHRDAVECADGSPADKKITPVLDEIPAKETEPEEVLDKPGLAGLNRFASCRRSRSWGGCADVAVQMDLHVEDFDPSDRDVVCRRRAIECSIELNCGRNWESVGPASC